MKEQKTKEQEGWWENIAKRLREWTHYLETMETMKWGGEGQLEGAKAYSSIRSHLSTAGRKVSCRGK